MSRIHWLTAPAWAAVGVSAFASSYATPEQAAQRSFPEATQFRDGTAQLTPEEMQAVAAVSGLPARSAAWRVQTAMKGDAVLGVIVFDSVIGKFELIDYAVGIASDGKISNVEILAYRESHGYEVRLPGWRRQFVGKGAESALRVNDDIANISGATMSSTHVTDGVRRIVAVVATLKRSGKL